MSLRSEQGCVDYLAYRAHSSGGHDQGLNDKCQQSRQSQAHDEHQPVTKIKSQQPTFPGHARVLGRFPSVPDELAQLSPSGCSLADTVHRNYLITPRYTMCLLPRRPALSAGVSSGFLRISSVPKAMTGRRLTPAEAIKLLKKFECTRG